MSANKMGYKRRVRLTRERRQKKLVQAKKESLEKSNGTDTNMS